MYEVVIILGLVLLNGVFSMSEIGQLQLSGIPIGSGRR